MDQSPLASFLSWFLNYFHQSPLQARGLMDEAFAYAAKQHGISETEAEACFRDPELGAVKSTVLDYMTEVHARYLAETRAADGNAGSLDDR